MDSRRRPWRWMLAVGCASGPIYSGCQQQAPPPTPPAPTAAPEQHSPRDASAAKAEPILGSWSTNKPGDIRVRPFTMEFKTDGSGSDIAGRFSWKHESVDPNRIVLNYGPNGSSGVQIELNWPENGARDTVVVHYLDSSSMGDQTFYRVR